MVKRILKVFSKEIVGLHEAAYLLALSSILSQVLALFRDRILAGVFGASTNLDIYYSAFRVPDLLFATIGSLVSASVIIPFFVERQSKGEKESKNFLVSVFYFYFLAIISVSVVAFALAPWIMSRLFPSFANLSTFSTLVTMTRILLLSPIFLGLSNLFSTVSQSHRRFFIYSISPVLYNVGIIFGIVFLYPIFGLSGLAMGVCSGAFLHFFIQAIFAFSKGFFPKFSFSEIRESFSHEIFYPVKKAFLTSIPRMVTVSSNEIAKLFLISSASFLTAGSISIFNFSFNLQSVPFAIIGVSYSMAAFPTLAKHFNGGDHKNFVSEMVASSRHIIFWSVPVSILFIVLRAQIVRVVLGSGEFNWNNTRLTAAALAIFTFSLIAQNLTALFVRSYYSRGHTLPPLLINIFSALSIVGLSYLLVLIFHKFYVFQFFIEELFKVQGIPGTVILMLPLGYSMGLVLNMFLHWADFHREFKSYSERVLKTFFQIFSASVIMGFVAYKMLDVFDGVFDVRTLLGIFLQGFVSGIFGIISGILVLVLLKNEEVREVWETLHAKIWKAKVVGPDATLD